MIEQGLITLLTADNDVQSYVQNRIYATLAPNEVLSPYIIFTKLSEVRRSGYCASDDVTMSVFQFDSYAKGYDESKLLSHALKNCLIDYRGLVSGTRIKSIKLENDTDLLDVDPGLYRVLTTLIIWHGVN